MLFRVAGHELDLTSQHRTDFEVRFKNLRATFGVPATAKTYVSVEQGKVGAIATPGTKRNL